MSRRLASGASTPQRARRESASQTYRASTTQRLTLPKPRKRRAIDLAKSIAWNVGTTSCVDVLYCVCMYVRVRGAPRSPCSGSLAWGLTWSLTGIKGVLRRASGARPAGGEGGWVVGWCIMRDATASPLSCSRWLIVHKVLPQQNSKRSGCFTISRHCDMQQGLSRLISDLGPRFVTCVHTFLN